MAALQSFSYEYVVRGYHIYQTVWDAQNGENLPCRRELSNLHDPFAVAVVKNSTTVGHVPKKVCSLFLRRNGTITCHVTGRRQYSRDLPQGGLEIPCVYVFEGQGDDLDKVKKLMQARKHKPNWIENQQQASSSEEAVAKRMKADKEDTPHQEVVLLDDCADKTVVTDNQPETEEEPVWLQIGPINLIQSDLELLSGGLRLNDNHINAGQFILKSQFPSIKGLSSTQQPSSYGYWVNHYLQVLHCGGNHWVAVSSIGCNESEVKVYDSIYRNISDEVKTHLHKILGSNVKISLPSVQKQIGSMDCGLFAMAFSPFLAHGNDPVLLSNRKFKQHKLRSHFIDCLEKGNLSEFV